METSCNLAAHHSPVGERSLEWVKVPQPGIEWPSGIRRQIEKEKGGDGWVGRSAGRKGDLGKVILRMPECALGKEGRKKVGTSERRLEKGSFERLESIALAATHWLVERCPRELARLRKIYIR